MPLKTIPLIRVFLSSPGDVNDERQIAIDHMEWAAELSPISQSDALANHRMR